MKRKIIVGFVIGIVLVLLIGTVLWHPWINQQAVDEYLDSYMEENYPGLLGDIRITLTDWEPLGHNFIVELSVSETWVKVGNGFINIFVSVTELELDLT